MSNETSLSFHGKTFIEIAAPGSTLFIDPVFSSERRGRRVRGDTRPADYVLVTQEGDDFEDVLDVLEDCDATLVGDERVCRSAQRELGLDRNRVLDLAEWERASQDDLRLTAVPIFAASMMDDGMSFVDELAGMSPLPRALSSLPFGRSARALANVPNMIRGEVSRAMRGKAGLGYLFEIGGSRILHLAAGIHAGTDERDLEDIAALGEIDVVSVDVGARGVEPFVRAARIFEPRTMLLYRSYDAYGRGRRAQALPLSAFVEAIREDRGDAVEVLALRAGDKFVVEQSEAAPAAKPATVASASSKPSLRTRRSPGRAPTRGRPRFAPTESDLACLASRRRRDRARADTARAGPRPIGARLARRGARRRRAGRAQARDPAEVTGLCARRPAPGK